MQIKNIILPTPVLFENSKVFLCTEVNVDKPTPLTVSQVLI